MNPLDAAALNDACRSAGLPWLIAVVDEIPSTSDALRDAAMHDGIPGSVLFAESQTRGRGRRDNRWLASKGRDLMFSLLLRPDVPLPLWPRFTSLAALAVCRAIEDELPLHPRIKWPNDIYLNDRKAAGLLAEIVSGKQGMGLVLGLGLNVNTREFPAELADKATSLAVEVRDTAVRELDRQRLAFLLLRELAGQFERVAEGFNEAIGEVRDRSWLLGKQIRATDQGREIFGRALDLNPEGQLVVAVADGSTITLTSADGVRQVM